MKRETNFYQQKQCYPHDYRTTLMLLTKILKKHTQKTHSAPEYTRGPRQGDIFCAFKGLVFIFIFGIYTKYKYIYI